jgi:hypothetical protein
LVIFIGKPIESEEFFNQMVETLDITADRCPKGKPRKRES